MATMTEIRWHGRGGQGVKTGALLFGEAILGAGKYMQAFPEFGPERRGAPVQAFNRISDEPITLHCGVAHPQVVIVLDPTLLGTVDVTEGLAPDGTVIINTSRRPEEIRPELSLAPEQKVCTLDASRIAREAIGRDIPNTPMVGALAAVTQLVDFEILLEDTERRLEHKFRHRPEVVQGNLEAIKRGYQEVQKG